MPPPYRTNAEEVISQICIISVLVMFCGLLECSVWVSHYKAVFGVINMLPTLCFSLKWLILVLKSPQILFVVINFQLPCADCSGWQKTLFASFSCPAYFSLGPASVEPMATSHMRLQWGNCRRAKWLFWVIRLQKPDKNPTTCRTGIWIHSTCILLLSIQSVPCVLSCNLYNTPVSCNLYKALFPTLQVGKWLA